MSLKSRCTRATDGSELFLLSLGYGGKVPHVYVLSREGTEDLVHAITSAVKSYDDAHKDDPPTPPRRQADDSVKPSSARVCSHETR